MARLSRSLTTWALPQSNYLGVCVGRSSAASHHRRVLTSGFRGERFDDEQWASVYKTVRVILLGLLQRLSLPAHDCAKSTTSFELDLRHASGRSRSARMTPAHGIWLNGVSRGVTVNPVWS